MPEILSVADIETSIGRLRLSATAKGLAHVALPHASGRGLAGWIASHCPGATLSEDPGPTQGAAKQILEYLDGGREVFEIPLDLRGTEFQLAAFEQIIAVRYGESRSYGELAEAMGKPKSMRAVGAAAGANPIPLVVPCHRIVGSGKHLTGYSGGVELQARLLAMERSHASAGERLL